MFEKNDTTIQIYIYPFLASVPILYTLKARENQKFTGVFRRYGNENVGWKLAIIHYPTNTPHVFHVVTTWKLSFRFNVEYRLCVCRVKKYTILNVSHLFKKTLFTLKWWALDSFSSFQMEYFFDAIWNFACFNEYIGIFV